MTISTAEEEEGEFFGQGRTRYHRITSTNGKGEQSKDICEFKSYLSNVQYSKCWADILFRVDTVVVLSEFSYLLAENTNVLMG